MKPFRVHVHTVASLLHDVPLADSIDQLAVLAQLFGGYGKIPDDARDVVKPILRGACPFLDTFPGRTFDEHRVWIAHIIADRGADVTLQPLAHQWYLPDQFPNDEQCERIIKAFKERRFYLKKPMHESGVAHNGNLVGVLRRCMAAKEPAPF